jgi:aldehyde:ferredoxin oxidoreductase
MRAVGRRITDLERWLDTERGLSKAEDTLPVRFLEEAVDVNGKAVVLGPGTWDRLRNEYYEYRGWSSAGVPHVGISHAR